MSEVPETPPPSAEDPVETAIDTLKPVIGNLTMGTVFGYCSGTALKLAGKVVAVVVGFAFISLQVAATAGYVQIDWKKVQSDALGKLDVTGDGKISSDDVKVYWKKFKEICLYRLPSAGGFSLGFFYAIK
jgi:uncharacterized membrane protein (Fun14 family)